ncbi:hypothetical protein HMPREF1093_01829 [Hungatella hathewayi 12489931]|nr:transposase [Hungatella hathewayi]ENY97397.1 hypothetical protein HMPREF1093_01829 [Hungatella hathewayi 12489931]
MAGLLLFCMITVLEDPVIFQSNFSRDSAESSIVMDIRPTEGLRMSSLPVVWLTAEGTADDEALLPAEKGVAFCNRLFFKERSFKELGIDERKEKRLEEETSIWTEFWSWAESVTPTGGSKLEKAVNYALNHRETPMNYLLDGRCEISNNSAERREKSYATGRKNFLFHDSVDGAKATAIVMSLIETARSNILNPFKYLCTLLLYMPDYKNEPTGIEQLMPWSKFVQIRCSGIIDDNLELPDTRGNLPI